MNTHALYIAVLFCRLSVIISLFIPFFNDIPRVVRASIMGIPVSGKAMAYMCGLQVN